MDHFERKYWTRSKNEFDQFFKDLNKIHPSIKFHYKASKKSTKQQIKHEDTQKRT